MGAPIADLAEARRELIVRRARLMVGDGLGRAAFEEAFARYLAALRGDPSAGQCDPRAADAVAEQIARLCGADATDADLALLRRTHQVLSGVDEDEPTLLDDGDVISLESDDPFGAEAFDAPRPTLVFALQDLGDSATASPPVLAPLQALLRWSASTTRAARALAGALDVALAQAAGTRALPSGPDAVILGAERAPRDAVLDLLSLGSAALAALDPEVRNELAGAVVLVGAPGDDDALTECAIRARTLAVTPGLVALDEGALDEVRDVVAEVPGAPGHLDPCAVSRQDRWEQSALLSRPPVTGRDAEAQALVDVLRGAIDEGGAHLMHIRGPAGIGKRTLLRQVLIGLGYNDETAPVLFGAVPRVADGSPPYGPVAAMVRAIAGAPVGAGPGRARLRRLVSGLRENLDGEDGRELALLEGVVAYLIDVADDDELLAVDRMNPRSLQVSLRRAFVLAVRALSRRGQRPPILIVSGAEDLDAPTRDLLAYLGRRLPKLIVIAITNRRWRIPRQLAGLKLVSREVSALDEDAARALLEAMLDTVQGDDIGTLAARARGSALSLIHLARYAIEGGLLRHEAGAWVFESGGATLPGRIGRVLEGRIDRLPETERLVLGCCGVLGSSFLADAVRRVASTLGVEGHAIDRALARLSETGFLARSVPRPGAPAFPDPSLPAPEMFAFEHPLLADAAQRALDVDERGAAHAASADALEALLGGDARAIAAGLARHHLEASNERRALPYLRVAARRAVRLDAPQLAVAAAQRALDALPVDDDEARFPIIGDLERALGACGDRPAQLEELKRLVHTAERLGEPGCRGRAFLRLARFHVMGGDAERAERACTHAMPALREADHRRGLAEACRVLAIARFERRDLQGAIDALNAASGHSTPDDVRGHAVVEHQLGTFSLEAGDATGALEHLMRARRYRRQIGDAAGEAACLDATADAFARRGRLHTALGILQRAITLRDRIGDDAGRAHSLSNLAAVALAIGDAPRARDLASDARDLGRQLGLDRLERNASVIAARAHLLEGDPQSAEQLLDNLRRRIDASSDPFTAMEAALFSARAKHQRAHTAKTKHARERLLRTALQRAKEATRLGESHGYASGQVLGMATTGEVLLSQDDPAAALLYAQRAAELALDRGNTALPVEVAHLAHARALEAIGDLEEARVALDRAHAAIDERAGSLEGEWLARFWSVGARRDVVVMRDRLREVA